MLGERYFEVDAHDCPSCKREVTKIEDYPRIRVGAVKVIKKSLQQDLIITNSI